jgi:hypothetical protein
MQKQNAIVLFVVAVWAACGQAQFMLLTNGSGGSDNGNLVNNESIEP